MTNESKKNLEQKELKKAFFIIFKGFSVPKTLKTTFLEIM